MATEKKDSRIERMFEAARTANLVGFPNGLFLERQPGGRWNAVLVEGDANPRGKSAHATGGTAEEALDRLMDRIKSELLSRSERAAREAQANRDAITELMT